MKIDLKLINRTVCLLFAFIILFTMITLKAQRYGDGNEYFLMLESFRNHFSPDLQMEDIKKSYVGERNAFGEKADPYWGYFKGRDQRWYSQHFWAYSLTSLPAKAILELFGFKGSRSLQITNALLFAFTLLVLNFFSKLDEKQKLLSTLLLTFSPALWFIHWTHPEIFILCWVTLSLIFFHSNKYPLAIISAVLASFQNQVLTLYVLFLLIKAAFNSHFKIKTLILYGALSALVFLPNAFYWMVFGRFNPLSDATALANISAFRVFEAFFDLNIGLLPYLPLSLLFFFGVILFRLISQSGFSDDWQIFILIIALITVCSATDNWNHGTSGPSRYVIWILPFIFYTLITNLKTIWKGPVLKTLFVSAVAWQVFIVVSGGLLVHEEDYLKHTSLAQFVLNRFPELYNPSYEIFCERTQHSESACEDPTIYTHKNQCKKALVTCDGLNKLESLCGKVDKNFQEACKNHQEKWFYVDY